MENPGVDVVLLAVRPNGHLSVWDRLRFAIGGAELVCLVASGCVRIEDGQLVTDAAAAPTVARDPLLAAAFADIQGSKRPPAARAWVAGRPQRIVDSYLEFLDAAGAIRTERRTFLKLPVSTRWYVLDTERLAGVRAQLDEIAGGGIEITTAQSTLAGLVNAIGLDKALYPGREGEAARRQLMLAGRSTAESGLAAQTTGDATLRAALAARDAALDLALHSAIDAAHSAAAHAAHSGGGHGAVGGGHH